MTKIPTDTCVNDTNKYPFGYGAVRRLAGGLLSYKKSFKGGFQHEGILEHDPTYFHCHRGMARLVPGRL